MYKIFWRLSTFLSPKDTSQVTEEKLRACNICQSRVASTVLILKCEAQTKFKRKYANRRKLLIMFRSLQGLNLEVYVKSKIIWVLERKTAPGKMENTETKKTVIDQK